MSKDRTKIIYQELMEKALHPSRVLQWIHEVDEEKEKEKKISSFKINLFKQNKL
jgi:hypothetical protein